MRNQCCLCKRYVLGMAGQDTVLDTYHLGSSPEDEQIAKESIFGPCHLRCLLSSKWRDYWTRRRISNLVEVRGFEALYEENGMLLLRARRAGINMISPLPGYLLFVDDRELLRGLDTTRASVMLSFRDRNWRINSSSSTSDLITRFRNSGRVSLLELADAFTVKDQLLSTEDASRGYLEKTKDTDNWLDKGVLGGTMVCSITLPRAVVAQLTELTCVNRRLTSMT